MRSPSLRRRALVVSGLLLVSVAACATNRTDDSVVGSRTFATSSYVVNSAEIAATGLDNSLDVLRRVRPELMRRRLNVPADDAFGGRPVLYVDGVFQGSLDLLSMIPA